jgi:hypothetical protein
VLSSLLLARSVPSGEHANSPRSPACPSSTDSASPVDASHSRAVSSPAPLAWTGNRSRVEDDKRAESSEPESYFADASVDQTEARYAKLEGID